MTDLKEVFGRLGLSQYLDAFVAEGFDTWQTVADVSEADLISLNVKLGHRRKLQRAISDWRRDTGTAPLPGTNRRTSIEGSNRSDESDNDVRPSRNRDVPHTAAPQSTKRKYRRHPKPDEHAPERPPSAYVIFSNQVRESLKGQEHSFSEIAKIVGERWQVLSPSSREVCDKQAAAAKEKYYQELAEYKKTPQYAQYQVYLAEFKAKYNANQSGREEGKRSKVETEPSSTGVSSAAMEDRAHAHRGDVSNIYSSAGHHRVTSADWHDQIARFQRSAPRPEVSPAARAFNDSKSPHTHDQFSPVSLSPASNTPMREHPLLLSGHGQDPRDRYLDPVRGSPAYLSTATSPSPNYYDPMQEVRQSRRDAPELRRTDSSAVSVPSLTHTETSGSSMSGASTHGGPGMSGLTLPPLTSLEGQKAHRTLPQPIPMPSRTVASPAEGLSAAALPTRLAPSDVSAQPAERRSGLDALLIATEMVGGEGDGVGNNKRRAALGDHPP